MFCTLDVSHVFSCAWIQDARLLKRDARAGTEGELGLGAGGIQLCQLA